MGRIGSPHLFPKSCPPLGLAGACISCCAVPVVTGWYTVLYSGAKSKQTEKSYCLLVHSALSQQIWPSESQAVMLFQLHSGCVLSSSPSFPLLFPSVSESSDATQPRPPVQVRRRFVIAALISQAPETETECESFNSVISSLGRTRKRSKEASCHPGMHTA